MNALAQSGNSGAMEEISVFGQQLDSISGTGSRLDLSVMETPATVDIINGDSIRDRIDTSVLEAVTRSAGFTNESNPGNGGQSIAARGFRGQGSVTKLFDGTNYYTAAGTITFPFDTWGVERIEVLKGPSSVLYGEGGIGGAINVVPKVPEQEQGGQVRVSLGEDDTRFIGIDLTGGLTDTVAYRLDYSNGRSDNWIDNSDSKTEMLSVALKWDVSEDLSLTARYDYGDQSPMKYFGIPVVDGDFAKQFLETNFNVGDAEVRYEDMAVRLKMDWTISDALSLQAEAYHLETERYWRNSEFYSLDAQTGLVDRFDPLELGHDMEHDGLRANFLLTNSLGNMALKSSFGFEINDISFSRPSNFGPANSNRVDFGADFDTVDPANFVPGSLSSLTGAGVQLDNVSDVDQLAF
ncbi:MAG: TonB-dependent receptor plug domain-containing protein, partial [Proteobacteria bacterium]|nr:TonB-dependent receptor plug domain-containing protein [Pseudomonadota bacterium]